jgi:two-component system, chemotaxis family, CheB/CheR fusion protein
MKTQAKGSAGKDVEETAATSPTKRRSQREQAFPIVGIGASAGGLEAVTLVLRHLPKDTGMAFVLVQHLDPTHESALTAILARSTAMPAVEAKNNMRIEPDHLYIIPPNKQMGISGRRLKLFPRGHANTDLAVDHFLRSLAEGEGNRAIGVVLSGNGADGTQGLLAVKAAGGITFAQSERTAKYPAMPGNAIAAGCVDFVLPPDRIGRELARIAGHPYIGPAEVEEEPERVRPAEERLFEEILAILRQRMGVDFTHYKHATLRRRIQRRMVLHKFESLKDYADYLRSQAVEVRELYNDILIHVTGFFRDASVFQTLKKKVFPRIMKHKQADEPVRIWVPGCSTGEEVYTVAICILEFLGDRKQHNPVQIFGTDIHDNALDKARAGLYPENIKTDVSAERLRRFFLKSEGGYRINKSVREMCIFARQNVVVDPPFSNIDLISCRNVLIYLGQGLQRKVMPLFHYALKPSGFLMLGASETVGGYVDLFNLAERKAKIYSKKATHLRPAVTFGPAGTDARLAPPEAPTPAAAAAYAPHLVDVQKQADRILLTHYSPSGVIINPQMEVLQFRGHTGPYLEHAHGEASLSLLKMAREGLILDLRTTVSKAIKQNTRMRQEGLRVKQNGHLIEFALEVVPFTVPPSAEKFFLVLFDPGPPAPEPGVGKRKALPGLRERTQKEQTEMGRLREELAATHESLQAIIEEQETTNEELRSANEEIMSSNEELQSTNEELETAKEELQSTNEELTTLNDELESRNTELETVNNDLHNLLASVNIPVLILSSDLRIRRFTTVAEKVFNLIPGDIGRPITDINLPLNIPDLPRVVMDVIDNLTTRELEAESRDGHWWSIRVRPYKTTDSKIDGAVIAVLNTDLVRGAAEQIKRGREVAEAMAQAARGPLLVLAQDLTVQSANRAFCQAFQIEAADLLNQRLYDAAGQQWNIPRLRELLEEILPRTPSFEGFELEHDFPKLGRRKLLLNAHRLTGDDGQHHLTVVGVEDVTTK